jgi:hypothetical protein
LRAVPVDEVLANQGSDLTSWSPVIDGTVLPDSVRTLFRTGSFNRVPVIEGSNHDEFRLFVAPVRAVVFDAGPLPGFGWSCFTAVEGESPAGTVEGGAHTIANEHARITVDAATGTYAIDTTDGLRVEGLGRLVDGGDGGDTYNYSPPEHDLVIDSPAAVRVTTLETGPVRARILIESEYEWPASAIGDERACSQRSDEIVRGHVATTLELRAGEQFLRVAHEIEKQIPDIPESLAPTPITMQLNGLRIKVPYEEYKDRILNVRFDEGIYMREVVKLYPSRMKDYIILRILPKSETGFVI